ncbi:MAG: hypothetical protein KC621_33255 [Myxococcales bacterium]|nr:hypothetical protein [Myxococcales bacterium]
MPDDDELDAQLHEHFRGLRERVVLALDGIEQRVHDGIAFQEARSVGWVDAIGAGLAELTNLIARMLGVDDER